MMRTCKAICFCALPLAIVACKIKASTTPPPADAPAELLALTGAKVLIGTGDIASCTSQGDEQTALLVDSMLKADSAAGVEDVVMALGDNAYPGGTARDYERCFAPSWGDSNKRIMKRIRPTPGNHEHLTDMAAPYYAYFGDKAGSSKKGYYSYDLGDWHVIVLNSEIVVNTSFLDHVLVAMGDQRRHSDGAHVRAEVAARDTVHAGDGALRRGPHELGDDPFGHGG
jgi:hypothetical protein